VIEYFSEEGVFHLQNLGHPRNGKEHAEGHGVPALKLPVEIIKTQ
jgi:hypothetical protein